MTNQRSGVLSGIIRITVALCIVATALYGVWFFSNLDTNVQNAELGFVGQGTASSPYLIQSADDLCKLSDAVNRGYTFVSTFFRQTEDIDLLEVDNWTPIGEYGGASFFSGVYDGDGHTITNLYCDGNLLSHFNCGLFGRLAGTVCNLGIESGLVQGGYIGGISSHSASSTALIINCYSKANVVASGRGGGIADNFGSGRIVCCAYLCEEPDVKTIGICSYNAGTLYRCFSPGTLVNHATFSGTLIESTIMQGTPQDLNQWLPEAQRLYAPKGVTLKAW